MINTPYKRLFEAEGDNNVIIIATPELSNFTQSSPDFWRITTRKIDEEAFYERRFIIDDPEQVEQYFLLEDYEPNQWEFYRFNTKGPYGTSQSLFKYIANEQSIENIPETVYTAIKKATSGKGYFEVGLATKTNNNDYSNDRIVYIQGGILP